MTKKCLNDVNPPNVAKFNQKLKDLSSNQKQNAYKLMKKKVLRWV